MTVTSSWVDLQRLMTIAGLYAHRLVADAGPLPSVLLIERVGELDVVLLDGIGQVEAAQVRRLLAQYETTSAALLFEASGTPLGSPDRVVCILGETIEGMTDERRYRVHPRSRRRRLTPLTDGVTLEVERLFRPLFPVHLKPRTPADALGNVLIEATSRAATDERIVAA